MTDHNATGQSATLPYPGGGFVVRDVPLPTPRWRPSTARCWHAALLIAGIARGATPEDLADSIPAAAADAVLVDSLERDEVLAHLDLILVALLGCRR